MVCPCPSHRDSLHAVFAKGETDFRLCQECGLVFREKFPTPDELDEIYRQAYTASNILSARTNQESGDFAIESYASYLTNSLIQPGMTVLDYGAATGALVAQMRRYGFQADGVEYSADARACCLATYGFRLMGGLEEVLPNKYDVVTMIEVIEHVTNLWATLEKVREVLKPGGVVFITTPNRKGIRARLEGGNWREARKKFHLFLFDRRSLRFHLRKSGFDEISRIVFSPVQKAGVKFWLTARITQLIGVPGTLCMIGRRP